MLPAGRGRVIGGFALLILIWGTTWAAIRIGLQGVPPFTGVAVRFAIAGAVLLALALAAGVRLGRAARQALYRGFAEAAYLLVELTQERFARVAEIDGQFAELDLGFVDAAVVALAESLAVSRIATTDRRHFVPLARAFRLELVLAAPAAG